VDQMWRERKQRVLTQGMPSITESIADAVVAKNGNIFFLTRPDGITPRGGSHGLGLYYHDCRFLKSYELKLAGAMPTGLASSVTHGFIAVFELTNPDIKMADGDYLRKEGIGIRWERLLDEDKTALSETLTFENFEPKTVEFPITLSFDARFEDVFAVRGTLQETPGNRHEPRWEDGALSFVYDGADGIRRSLSIHFSPAPAQTEGETAHFTVKLQPQGRQQIMVSLVVAESRDLRAEPQSHYRPNHGRMINELQRSSDQWMESVTEFRSDSRLLNLLMDRSLRDLNMLRSALGNEEYFAAGVPWFVALFGRDSLITALQTLAYDPGIAARTLRLLAKYQAQKADQWRDAQPGKIMHELRDGELAHIGEIPQTPYYGTVDATPLFLILLAIHSAWTGDLALFKELRGNVEAALEWIAKYGDSDGDGYVEYASATEHGLVNQGWKDSGDAMVNADGSLAGPPIALVEVQGYVYLAKILMADLYQRGGERQRADDLRKEAADLRERFNRDFWMEEKGVYAMALQADNKQVAVVSSNPGQALWTGIAEPDKARRTMERLMADDMFSGWGVRTLSGKEKRYNPVGYHLGTVWPHDNSIIAAGMRRYGFDDAAQRIFTGIIEAATHFEHHRLPEVFSGFGREEFEAPVRYPVANHPQAWASGAVPFLIQTVLGLEPNAFEGKLRVAQPMLPEFADWIEVRRLKVGDAVADLRFERAAKGGVAVRILRVDGRLAVEVEEGRA
jgi:glycogen debranching enzyme